MGFMDNLQEAIIDKINDLPGRFNPEVLNDDVAMQTRWEPLVRGGSNFASRKIEKISSSRMEYKPTIMAKIFPAVFILVGLGVAIIPTVINGFEMIFSLATIGGGFSFLVVGFIIHYLMSKPIVFDMDTGYFFKGKNDESNIKNRCDIKDIYAIQLVAEWVSGAERESDGGSSYTSVEVNLVLENGLRINVIDQGGDIEETIIEAGALAEFLDVPLWNAVG